MLFNSWQYFVFLPAVVLLYYLIPHKFRWVLLLLASYYFYMSWNAQLIALISTTTITSYLAAILIEKSKNVFWRKTYLVLGITISLAILFYFKYFNFFSESVTALMRAISLPVSDFTISVMLPVGISFYSFQTLSYVIDVYRGDLKAKRHLGIYALYVSFFPQLVAGPIERAVNLLPQFDEIHTPLPSNMSWGMRMICWGMFKKLFLADALAVCVNAVYNNLASSSASALLLATFFFAIQIYCDFSGYSDIALGSAKLLGFDLMINFKSPYFTTSLRAFWRRWHISLSSWLTDYIYIPLGGNRKGLRRTIINLMITFLLSGLWHGAKWTFVIWGAMQGILVAIDTLTLKRRQALEKRLISRPAKATYFIITGVVTFTLVCLSWVMFRANGVADAIAIYKALPYAVLNFSQEFAGILSQMGLTAAMFISLILRIAVLFIFDAISCKTPDMFLSLSHAKTPVRFCVSYALGFVLILGLLLLPESTAVDFIYFQF